MVANIDKSRIKICKLITKQNKHQKNTQKQTCKNPNKKKQNKENIWVKW